MHSGKANGIDVRNGTVEKERFVMGQGNDIVNDVGSGDVVQGGSGNDNVFLGVALDFLDLDGGSGQDTLALTGSGQSLDLGLGGAGARVSGFETFDITGSGDNSLFLDAASVLDIEGSGNLDFSLANSVNNLVVEGDAGDEVTLSTLGGGSGAVWMLDGIGLGLDGTDPGNYNIWKLMINGSPSAFVAVNNSVNVNT